MAKMKIRQTKVCARVCVSPDDSAVLVGATATTLSEDVSLM